jgi:hypothetical protein
MIVKVAINWKGCGRKSKGPNLRYNFSIGTTKEPQK